MLRYYTQQKQNVCCLLRDKNSNFALLILISVSKLITFSKFTNTDILAVIIDDEFSWQSHVTYVCKTLSKTTKNTFSVISAQTLCGHFQAQVILSCHISSHLTYASTVRDGCSDILFKKLNSLHRRAAKLMLPDPSTTKEAKIQRLGLLPL